jgi:preprotein translocase subunit SecA
VKNIAENTRYINVAFPITDGKKTLNTVVPVQKAYDTHGREVQLSIEKGITLAIIDDLWKEHLRQLDDLRQSVQNASYEQKDPLLIYKFESFKLFEKMLLDINREITSFLSRATLPVREESDVREARQPQAPQRGLKTGRSNDFDRAAQQQRQAIENSSQQPQRQMPVHVEKKVGRNDPCPCGSGKKYKNCHGRGLPE